MIIIYMQANIRMWSAFSTWINVIALNPNKVGSFKTFQFNWVVSSRNLLLLLFYNSFSLLNINAQNLTFQLILERIFGLFSPNCDELCRPRKLNDRVYSRFVQQHVLQYDTNLQSVTNYSKIKIKQWRLFISHFLSRFLSRHSEKKSWSF